MGVEPTTETFTSGMFNGLIIKQDYQGSGSGLLPGRWAGARVGTSGDDDAYYLAGYAYQGSTGRLDRVTGPGLPAYGAVYGFVTNSDLVATTDYRSDETTTLLRTTRAYETTRDLIDYVKNKWIGGGSSTVVSKYDYTNDILGRRTNVAQTSDPFTQPGALVHGYNDRNELTSTTRGGSAWRAYTYDPIGNRTEHEEGTTPLEGDYTRNALNQYPRVDVTGGSVPVRQGYSFDLDGNMTEQWAVGDANCDGHVNNFDIDAFVLAISDPEEFETTYPGCDIMRCDANGDGQVNNSDIDPFIELLGGQGAIARRLVWDGENRLVRVEPAQSSLPTDGSAKRVSFKYDYLGRRIEKVVETWTAGSPNAWVATKHRRFVWDGWLMLLELDTLNSNAVVRRYTWGLDLAGLAGGASGGRSALEGAGGIGGLLAVDVQAADPDTSESGGFWFKYDANGNVMELVAGATGYGGATADEWHADRLVGRYEYDPYGNVVNSPSTFALTNPVRLSTKYWDDETGLGYWGYRYYDSRLGRWVNRDLLEELGGEHLYALLNNSPIMHIDPVGLQATSCAAIYGPCWNGSWKQYAFTTKKGITIIVCECGGGKFTRFGGSKKGGIGWPACCAVAFTSCLSRGGQLTDCRHLFNKCRDSIDDNPCHQGNEIDRFCWHFRMSKGCKRPESCFLELFPICNSSLAGLFRICSWDPTHGQPNLCGHAHCMEACTAYIRTNHCTRNCSSCTPAACTAVCGP